VARSQSLQATGIQFDFRIQSQHETLKISCVEITQEGSQSVAAASPLQRYRQRLHPGFFSPAHYILQEGIGSSAEKDGNVARICVPLIRCVQHLVERRNII
jgi:hypothetical protein